MFHLLKESERTKEKDIVPYEVYWQSIKIRTVYGPFVDTYSAMSHHSLMVAPIVLNAPPGKPEGSVIEVDFKLRKRK